MTKQQTENKHIKRLYKSQDDKMIAGVCGGIGEYLAIDPVWVRIIAVVLIFIDGIGLLLYIILWILMPHNPYIIKAEEKKDKNNKKENKDNNKEKNNNKTKKSSAQKTSNERVDTVYTTKQHKTKESNSGVMIGIIFIFLGAILLLKPYLGWIKAEVLIPLLIIGLGITLLIKSQKK